MSADPRSSLPLGETLEFLGLIWSVDHALQTLSKRMQGTLGVTGPQRLLLRIVARFPGLPAGEIAGRFSVSAPTISRHLSLLEAAGLVSYHREANRLIYEAEPESLASALNGFLSAVCPTQILERKRRKK